MKKEYLRLIGFILATVYFFMCIYYPGAQNGNWHFINSLDLIFHEAGHTLMPPFVFGEFMSVLGGSLFQVFIPVLLSLYFIKRKDAFSSSILLMWAAESIAYVSVYAGDSMALAIPLLGGDSVVHDWNYLLWNMSMLHQAEDIGKFIYFLAWMVFILAFSVGLRTFFIHEEK